MFPLSDLPKPTQRCLIIKTRSLQHKHLHTKIASHRLFCSIDSSSLLIYTYIHDVEHKPRAFERKPNQNRLRCSRRRWRRRWLSKPIGDLIVFWSEIFSQSRSFRFPRSQWFWFDFVFRGICDKMLVFVIGCCVSCVDLANLEPVKRLFSLNLFSMNCVFEKDELGFLWG